MLALPSEDGKITAEQVEELYQAHIRDESFEHTVQPKMVYISNPTELGTIYTRAEMENLYGVCRKYGLYLFVDGARLAYGLAAEGNDLDLKVPGSFLRRILHRRNQGGGSFWGGRGYIER